MLHLDLTDVASDEGHLCHPCCLRPGARRGSDRRIHVDPDDATGRADQLGGQEGHVTRTAADIEHLHPGRDARILEEEPGGPLEKLGPLYKASRLVLGPSHHVGRIALAFLIHRSFPNLACSSRFMFRARLTSAR